MRERISDTYCTCSQKFGLVFTRRKFYFCQKVFCCWRPRPRENCWGVGKLSRYISSQGWANSGPRAKCGPPQRFQWPV